MELVDMLLKAGADAKVRSLKRSSPLTGAVLGGNREIVELFLSLGADVNDGRGVTPPIRMISRLVSAACGMDRKVLETFLSQGSDLKGGRRSTPLTAAAWRRNVDLVELLVRKGADVNVWDSAGLTPLLV